MFPIPNLPTDSLYKFLFVGGLILMIASFYLSEKTIESSDNDILKFDTLASNKDKIVNKLKGYNMQTDYLLKLVASKNIKNYKIDSILLINNNIKQQADSLMVLDKSNRTQYDIAKAVANRRGGQLNLYSYMQWIGFMMLIAGTLGWFFITQLVQDKILKKQLQILELEYNAKLNPPKFDPTKYNKR